MRKLATALAAAAVTLLVLTGLSAAPADAAEPGTEAQFVAAINNVRAGRGLPPLAVHNELVGVARNWTDQMVAAGAISHNPNLANAVSANWAVLGENVGVGYDVDGLMQAFINSAAHYRNLVEPRYDTIGVGVTWGPDGRMYTTHVFMDLADSPAPPPAPAPAPAPAPPAPPRRARTGTCTPRRAGTPAAADHPPGRRCPPARGRGAGRRGLAQRRRRLTTLVGRCLAAAGLQRMP